MKIIGLLFVAVITAMGQGIVNQTAGPPPDNFVDQFFYSGSNLTYDCRAASLQPPTTFYVSSSTLTSIAVSSNVGTVTFSSTFYGWIGMTITVAGSATTALNGTYRITAVSGSTGTITTSGVSNATYNDSTLTLTTNGPLLNAAVWAIHAFKYDGSNNLIGAFWEGTPSTNIPQLACSNRANY